MLTESSIARTVMYTYGTFGLVTTVTAAAGTTIMGYDSRGNLISREEPGKPKLTYTYDAEGRMRTETVAGRWTTEYRYEDPRAPHMPSSAINPLKQAETRTYNALGLATEVTDVNGFTSTFGYDDAGRQIRAVNPGGGITA